MLKSAAMQLTPVRIEPLSPIDLFISWNDGRRYSLTFVELRYYCPCAGCVDEHTGQRTIDRTSVSPEIRPTDVQLVGRYAIQMSWSDGHATGIYHYDRLLELCEKQGRQLPQAS
jgi:DUF971 family protein